MSERIVNPKLQKLYDDNVPVYSISRLDTINGCLAEAYKTYVLHEKGRNNVYSSLGGRIHDVLEDIMNGKATEADLQGAMESELFELDMLGVEFPKDRNGGDTIRDGWIADMTHFCNTYKAPKNGKFETEQFFLYKTPKGRYLQGYIDLIRINEDDSISIYDYKTSAMYKGADIDAHARQLILYALGKEQEGYAVKSISWIFLKYVDFTYWGYKTSKSKECTEIKKTVERRKIGSEMADVVAGKMARKYDSADIALYLEELKRTNDFSCLPEDIQSEFKITPCVYSYELTDRARESCIEYIEETIDKWESMNVEDESAFTPRSFEKITKTGKISSDIFYCTCLCSHFNSCAWIQQYLAQKDELKEDDDSLF